MFSAFIEKVKDAFGVTSVREGHVAPDDATIDHDSDSAATISATSHAWGTAKDNVAYIKDCTQSIQFGSIAYTKGAEGQDETNDLIDTSNEAATDDVIPSTWSDDDLISSGTDDTKFVIRGGLKAISVITSDAGHLPIYSKTEHASHSFAQQHEAIERGDAEMGARSK